MPPSDLDTTALETISTNVGASVGRIGDKVRGYIDTIRSLNTGNAGEQAKVDAVVAGLNAVVTTADAIEALTVDIVDPNTPPVDPEVPVPELPADPGEPTPEPTSRSRR